MKFDGPKLITPPAEEPVSVAEAKAWCRVDGSDEDPVFTRLISAARSHCEHLTDRAFVTQTLQLTLREWPDDEEDAGLITLLRPPVQSVSWIKYMDEAGVQQTWGTSEYQLNLDADPAVIARAPNKSWPAVQDGLLAPIQVQYIAGYGAATAVPPAAKQMILLLVSHWYENREAVLTGTISKEVELAVRSLASQLWVGRLY